MFKLIVQREKAKVVKAGIGKPVALAVLGLGALGALGALAFGTETGRKVLRKSALGVVSLWLELKESAKQSPTTIKTEWKEIVAEVKARRVPKAKVPAQPVVKPEEELLHA